MIGTVLDRYEILQKLGEGATSTVYRGRQTTIGRDVAVKVLHPHLAATPRYRERFQREARAVGRLNHPNIVSILDFSGPDAAACYLVTELVDGVTLLRLLEDLGPLPSELAAAIGMDLADALAFAHRQGIVHRDVKPENVMIRRDGTVKLMDFGVARLLDEASMTQDGSLLGSPAYMSPEQAMDGALDGRTDLFSLGSVLFHAISGHVPFAGTNPSVILRNIIDGRRPDLLELAPVASPALDGVIDRLLATEPAARHADADAARAALGEALRTARLDRGHALLDLRAWLIEPAASRAALDTHLRAMLLEDGRARLPAGDTLGALQQLNRLLAMDDANAEAIALVQSLHQAPEVARPRWRVVAGTVAVAALAALALAWALRPPVRPSPPLPVNAPPAAGVAPPAAGPALPRAAPSGDLRPERVPETPPGIASPSSAPRAGTARSAAVRPAAPDAAPTSYVVLQVATPVEVWVDGNPLGRFRMGPSETWVGTRARPLTLPAGEHLLSLRNNAVAEAWESRIVFVPGETHVVQAELRRKPVTFQVDPALPSECRVAAGTTEYGPVRAFGATFTIREPEAGTRLQFRCPPPLGTFEEMVGPTFGGEFLVVPRALPGRTP